MNHKSTFQSSFGGFIANLNCPNRTSIVTIFLVFLFFSTNFIDYLAGKNIITKQTQVYDDQLSNLQLDDQDFIMALGIEQNNFISQPYFTLNLQQRQYERLSNGTIIKNITQLPLVPCTLDRFHSIFQRYGKNFSEDFERLQLQNLLCPQNQLNMNIGGTFTSNNFNFLKIEVTSCNQSQYTDIVINVHITQNQTLKNLDCRTCAQEDELKQQLEENGNFKVQVQRRLQSSLVLKLSLYSFERQICWTVINPNKIGSDFVSIYLDDRSYLSFVPKQINKQANIFFRQYQFQNSLDLYPFNQDQNSNFISIDDTQTKEIADLGRDSDAVYAAFYFRKSPITTLVERKNQSIIDLLSKLGGLFQISFIVMGFIIATYNKITMLVELSNKVYEFSTDIEAQNKQHQQNLKMIDHIYEDKQFRQDYYVNREGQYSAFEYLFVVFLSNLHINQLQQQIPNSEIRHKSKILQLFRKHYSDKHVMLIDRPPTENNEYVNQGSNENEDKSTIHIQVHYTIIKLHSRQQRIIIFQLRNSIVSMDWITSKNKSILSQIDRMIKLFQLLVTLEVQFEDIFQLIVFQKNFLEFTFRIVLQLSSVSSYKYKNSDKINEQLDVFNILNKLNEIDKLKEILLTNSQQLLFDFAAKPIISLIEEKEMHFSRTFLEERARNTIEQYKNKKIRRSQLIQQSLKNLFRTQSLDRDHRIYKRIYRAYDLVLQQSMDQNPQYEVNQKLIKKLGDEIQAIFKLSKLLDFDGIKRLRANSNQDQICRNTQNIPDEIILK